jgi:hypothetical protein
MSQFVNNGSDIPHSLAGFDRRSVRSVYTVSAVYVIRHSGLIMGTSSLAWGTSQSTDVGEDNLAVPRFLQRLPAL